MTGLEIYSDKMDLADLEYSNSRKRIKTSDAMVSFRRKLVYCGFRCRLMMLTLLSSNHF